MAGRSNNVDALCIMIMLANKSQGLNANATRWNASEDLCEAENV